MPGRVRQASSPGRSVASSCQRDCIAACGTVTNDRTNLLHFLRIAEHLSASNAELNNWLHGIAARYAQAWGDPAAGQAAALKRLWLLAYREAQVQAFADAYLAIALCFALVALMVPLMREVPAR